MPAPVKYGKIYMKDASGSIVQIIPDAAARHTIYQGATSSSSGVAGLVPPASTANKNKFLRGDGTWEEATPAKEVAVVDSAPTSINTANLGNESVIFYADGVESNEYSLPVTTSGNQTVNGVKTFLDGIVGDVNGTATKAVQDVDGNAIKTTYATKTYVDEKFEDAPESSYLSSEPDSEDIASLANGSIVFCENESETAYVPEPVYTTGNQTVNGIKKFSAGFYEGVKILASNESTFDCNQSNCFVKSITEDTVFNFSNVPADTACTIKIVLTNGGSFNVSWPGTVKWSNNASPSLNANGTDILVFFTYNGGNTWYGSLEFTESNI